MVINSPTNLVVRKNNLDKLLTLLNNIISNKQATLREKINANYVLSQLNLNAIIK